MFLIGSGMAGVALVLSLLVPRDPEPGREVIWSRPVGGDEPRRVIARGVERNP